MDSTKRLVYPVPFAKKDEWIYQESLKLAQQNRMSLAEHIRVLLISALSEAGIQPPTTDKP